METSFSENGCTIKVRSQKGSDVLDSRVLYSKLVRVIENAGDEVMSNRISHFGAAMTQSALVEGDAGFRWAFAGDSAEQLLESFQGFCDIEPALMFRWIKALEEVETPPNDPDLLPPEAVEKKGSKPPKS